MELSRTKTGRKNEGNEGGTERGEDFVMVKVKSEGNGKFTMYRSFLR